MVITREKTLAEKIKILRQHGANRRYFYQVIGGNFRLDAIQAAILSVKLKYLDEWNEKRGQNAALYDKMFADSPVTAPKIAPNNISIYHQYTVRVSERDKLQSFLAENEISSAVFYPKPLHLQDCFKQLGYRKGDLPVAEGLCGSVLSLPVYPELSAEQIEYVARTVLKFYEKGK